MADYEKGVQSFDGAGRIQPDGIFCHDSRGCCDGDGTITETEITGNSDTGTASGNTLNVTDASSDSTGIRIYGGTVSGGESGDASKNTVNVTNTQVSQAEIYGGQSRLGATNNNTVIFDSSSTAAAVYGAYGNTASGNHVESAGTSNFLYGGRSYTNNSGNSVLVTGGSVQYTLSGSQADNGSAADNTVEIKKKSCPLMGLKIFNR
ncbi:MAG: hypothetical protein OGM58_00005 [Veillonellaceae bacterium]|nr:MAG: hypothetical protein OGM58_00005 [Veillonellaceae bacterium]